MKTLPELSQYFQNRRPLLNIILDGYGLGKQDHTDAVFQAKTPFMDHLRSTYAKTELVTHGKFVGLPGKKDLGGSEVGHLTIGAGQMIPQGPTLITNSIEDGSFFKFPVLNEALQNAKSGALHLIGLLSDGNVHSHIDHFIAIIEESARQEIEKVYVHALLDGRDVAIQSADQYIDQLESLFASILDQHPDWDYAFASGGGRELITMDRDKNWTKVEAGWQTHVEGNSGNNFKSAKEAVLHFRSKNPGLVDQDCPAFNILSKTGDAIKINDGDSVISMNFRADRAVELTMAFVDKDFSGFAIERRPDIYFAGMMVYDEDNDLPQNRIIGSPEVPNPFGKRILELGLNQFRLAETQKYAHVTFFFNGGYRNPLDPEKEIYHLIPSDKIDSFARQPRMKAQEIADQAVKLIKSGKFDYGLINFANADMVGHTGDMKAAIEAVETVDAALEKICKALTKAGGIALITADHGNADEMIIINKKTGKEEISTKHSINPVPLVIFDSRYSGEYSLKPNSEQEPLTLSMIAATNFILMGQNPPNDLDPFLFAL
ncbi:MAG: 2,3-bisphosphoglycerate-independent phosphoglycerate mutase [Proteobacteria bacterium]|nr:2,3-bisphosphoglycerate-independent phosphoglycerate mutase [Pseudomonadota bacterium]